MEWGWKVTARQYLKTRAEVRRMDADTFDAYHDKWLPVVTRKLAAEKVGEALAKAIGFRDAIVDEALHRDTAPDDPAHDADTDFDRLLDYLYEEDEGG